MTDFGRIQPSRLTGDEPIAGLGASVLEFWRWSASDLLSNATRGVFAEFLVARALADPSEVRQEWDAHDVTTPDGIRVEVKSSAYIQSWHQEKPSRISFGIAPTRAWDADTNKLNDEARRQADVYVFALLDVQDQSRIDPLDGAQWQFRVVSSRTLDEKLEARRTIGLATLDDVGAIRTDLRGLAAAVKAASSP